MVRNASGALSTPQYSLKQSRFGLSRDFALSFCFDAWSYPKRSATFRNHAMDPRYRYLTSSASALMRCLRIADGLNTITRRGEIGTSLPVLGLRPILWPLLRTTKEPKEDNFTVSPRSRQSVISFSTSSTSVADSVRDNPTFW